MPDLSKPPAQNVVEALRYEKSILGVLFAYIIENKVESATLTKMQKRLPSYVVARRPYIPDRIRSIAKGAKLRGKIQRATTTLRHKGLAVWTGPGKYRFLI